jgi:dephospho-CoA kinase
MLTVGLTGGIGCGKSTVAQRLREHGIPIIDADEITRDLVAPGSPLLERVVEAFGTQVLDAAGHLARRRLRDLVFHDQHARRCLEQILHPAVRNEIDVRIEALVSAPYCVVVVPLLVETEMDAMFDRLAVVDCAPELQVQRVCARDGCPQEQVMAIIASQAPRETRLAKATDVIENNAKLAQLLRDTDAFHARLLDQSKQQQRDSPAE